MATMSNFGFLLGIALFLFMMTFVLWGVVVSLERVEKVNDQLPEDQRFEALGWYYGKRRRFERECETLFPDRKLRRKERTLMLLGAIALLGACPAMGWL
jgi:hypothetical protein